MNIDFAQIFALDTPILELFLRGTLMYLGIFCILRVVLTREIGSVGIPDLLMVTLIADAAQNGLSAQYRSITSGILLVGILVFWNYILDWAACRFRWIERMTRPPPLCLVRNGKVQRRALKSASMSRNELLALLRENEAHDISKVKTAYLEADGKLSVAKK